MMKETTYEELADRYRIELILQFGSTVTGKTHARSDLDLAVLFRRLEQAVPSPDALGELQGDLQSMHRGTVVDLVDLNRADPLLLKKVTESCRLLYGTPRKLHELKILAFKRYQDHRKYLALERAYVERAAREPAAR